MVVAMVTTAVLPGGWCCLTLCLWRCCCCNNSTQGENGAASFACMYVFAMPLFDPVWCLKPTTTCQCMPTRLTHHTTPHQLQTQTLSLRDGAPVFINYKSQFKDGGSGAPRSSRKNAAAGGGGTSSKAKGGRGGKRGGAAAAAAAGGLTTGFVAASQLDGGQGPGGSGGTKRRRKSGKKGGSGGGKRKRSGGGGGGRWSTVGGQRVSCSGWLGSFVRLRADGGGVLATTQIWRRWAAAYLLATQQWSKHGLKQIAV